MRKNITAFLRKYYCVVYLNKTRCHRLAEANMFVTYGNFQMFCCTCDVCACEFKLWTTFQNFFSFFSFSIFWGSRLSKKFHLNQIWCIGWLVCLFGCHLFEVYQTHKQCGRNEEFWKACYTLCVFYWAIRMRILGPNIEVTATENLKKVTNNSRIYRKRSGWNLTKFAQLEGKLPSSCCMHWVQCKSFFFFLSFESS